MTKSGIKLIEEHLDAIRALAEEYDVARLEVFGSATTDDFDLKRSDIDLLIEYKPGTNLGPWIKRYFELQERLEALLGRPVDLIMAGAPRNPYVIQSINETRQLLYAA
jgi:predicted nucleotidyltransferase